MDAFQEAQRQLAAIRADVARGNPELYRHLALYLQVLRQGLLPAMQQACFHLATQLRPDRYCRLPAARRHELHRRMEDLARRACTLLTVEQVTAMAAQIARVDQRERHQDQARMLEHLRTPEPGEEERPSPEASDWPRAPGSIHLAMAPPIDPRHLPQATPPAASDDVGDAGAAAQEHPGTEPAGGAMEAMVQAFSEALAPETLEDAEGPEGGVPWSDAGLPTDPTRLLTWLTGYERALTRRLRNLSHALNMDCLRLGLTQGLLPVGLLDAALQGQVEMLPAPANLLRLQVPAEAAGSGAPLALVAVLLRLVDLELEDPRLRTCRQRLQQHTQEVRRMAQTYRRVQRRLRTLEAERLWLEDNRTPAPPRDPAES
ncbi:conserved hypothetical protein [Cyanobium sp. PCC 7001]|uniref:hypothetical protein n=1 Tax=Cyanobium sp. PCC 7001 TaxID=180281 RepID=UPI0001805932|nr:hypothetical protein [Cyanobium sp. PCC 7001]EDY38161.1 conserved hypothetical protein [Cyanobium sp. PCC 7001]